MCAQCRERRCPPVGNINHPKCVSTRSARRIFIFSEIRPQVGTAPILIWMPEISLSAPLRLRHPQSGPAPKWGRIRDQRNSQARPGAFEISGTRLRTEVTPKSEPRQSKIVT